jgi:hypothetical protein
VPIDAPGTHPNLPRRGLLALMFMSIVVCGMLGGTIGYGLVRTSCPRTPTVADQLSELVPGFHAHVPSCDPQLLGGALSGTVLSAIGAGVVAMLMLRAQSEWRTHPAGRVRAGRHVPASVPAGRGPPVRKKRSGGTPPRT